jgi:hypothetical protein
MRLGGVNSIMSNQNKGNQPAAVVNQPIPVKLPDGRTFASMEEALSALSAEAAATKAERDAAIAGQQAAEKAKQEADAKLAEAAAAQSRDFRVKVATYSNKPQKSGPNAGKLHPKAGKPKGTFEVYSRGSRFAVVFSRDQWQEIAHDKRDEIDAFVKQHDASLLNMADIIAKGE